MSKKQGNKFVVEEQKPEQCEYCGEVAELRPYGKNGANICFKCMMKNENEAKKQYGKLLENVDIIVVKGE
jgi:hypothetical protein